MVSRHFIDKRSRVVVTTIDRTGMNSSLAFIRMKLVIFDDRVLSNIETINKQIMQDTIDILDYVIHWRSKSETGFTGELYHIVRNSSGGSLLTPVGYLAGFIEPASEYYAAYWKIILTVRDEIRYDIHQNTTSVFVKSAYASKLKYHIHKLMQFTHDVVRINPKLPTAIQEVLIKAKFCSSPIAIQMTIGKAKYVYSNVEFNFD